MWNESDIYCHIIAKIVVSILMTDKIESDVKSLLDINSMLNYRKN